MGACLGKVETETAAPWLELLPEIANQSALGKAEGETAAPWPELLPEIANLVLRCLPDHGDRASFGAVCHEWRRLATGLQGLPPAMPCLNLGDGIYQSLIGGKVRCFPTPKGYRAGASFDRGWIFYHHDGSSRCFLRRPFSGDAIEIPTSYPRSLVKFPTARMLALRALPDAVVHGRCMDMKMFVCSSRLVVALFRHRSPRSYLASFRPAQLQQLLWSFVVQPDEPEPHPAYIYRDVALYDGKLFALSFSEELFCHDVDGGRNVLYQRPIIQHVKGARGDTLDTNSYMVVSSDKQKLLMVRWRRNGHRAMDLWVFEADFVTGRWSELQDLGGQVLFLGKNCSMAFAAGSMEHWGPRFRGGNRVFVLGTEWERSFEGFYQYKGVFPGYCVYDMVTGETSLVSLHGPRDMESCTLSWFFPMSENL